MALWESPVCDDVLSKLLQRLTVRPCAWDSDFVPGAPGSVNMPCTIKDIEMARNASPLWRDIIDDSPEWAAIRLARYDFDNEVGVIWEAYKPYVMSRSFVTWEVFSTSWKMHTPIVSRRLRLDPIGWLSEVELATLRSLLWDPENVRINVEEGGTIRHAPDVWVSHLHRC
ncbi:hypothetical protein M758_UG289800 [Ceratodon purpureus]|nr:hypothetical protein M758_UG289800 [Ceratodon purpureus]